MLCHVYRHGCDIPELQYYMAVSFIPNLLLVCHLAHSFRWGISGILTQDKRRPMSDSQTTCLPLRCLCGMDLQYIFLHAFANLGDSTPHTRIHFTIKNLSSLPKSSPMHTSKYIKYVLCFCQHRHSWLRSWKQTGVSVFTEDSLNKIRPMAENCVTGRHISWACLPAFTTVGEDSTELIEDSKENRAGTIFCATIFPFDHWSFSWLYTTLWCTLHLRSGSHGVICVDHVVCKYVWFIYCIDSYIVPFICLWTSLQCNHQLPPGQTLEDQLQRCSAFNGLEAAEAWEERLEEWQEWLQSMLLALSWIKDRDNIGSLALFQVVATNRNVLCNITYVSMYFNMQCIHTYDTGHARSKRKHARTSVKGPLCFGEGAVSTESMDNLETSFPWQGGRCFFIVFQHSELCLGV